MSQESVSASASANNVGKTERTLSAIAGSLLLYYVTRKHKADTLLLAAGGYLLYRAVAGHCPISTALHTNRRHDHPSNVNVRTEVVVNRPREQVYAFWRQLENLPLFMKHLESVDEFSPTISAWKIRIPGGLGEIRWEAEIVKEVPDSELSWQSVTGSGIENTGKINFSDTPGGGTRIDVLISYRAPMGVVGERLSRLLTPLFRDLVEKDILSFKNYMENVPV